MPGKNAPPRKCLEFAKAALLLFCDPVAVLLLNFG